MARSKSDAPMECFTYRIRFRGQISAAWLATFDTVTLTTAHTRNDTLTTIVCRAVDQAALMGILNMIYELGGELVFIHSTTEESMAGVL